MYMALAVVSGATVYAAVGIVACQWLPTSRGALQLATGVLVIDFVLRVVADTADYGWMHWITPLGWIEEMRAFTGPRPHVLLLPAAATAILLVVGLALETKRDTGAALLAPTEEVRNPSLRFLGSPALLALRSQVLSVAIWIAAISGFAYVIGTASKSVASGLSKDVQDLLNRLGVKIATPSGYIGLTFLFFVFAISLFCCSQLAAMREDEAEGRLETLFALPASRTRWLIERLALAALAATLIAVLTGLSAALGARTVGADVSFLRLLGAGFNALPASLLFLGVGALLNAAAPRIGVGAAYAVVTSAFVWELVGALLSAPSWLLGVSPFHQVALVPAVPFRLLPAVVMLATGLAAATAAVVRFRTRDLVGA
jgi:ABC-2 type transport system permease protein